MRCVHETIVTVEKQYYILLRARARACVCVCVWVSVLVHGPWRGLVRE